MEYTKTQLQLSHGGPAAAVRQVAARQYTGVVDVVRHTLRTHGFLGLYSGSAAYFVFAVPRGASRFWMYENVVHALSKDDGDKNVPVSAAHTLLAGVAAGLTEAAVAVVPMTTIAVRMCHDASMPQPRFRNVAHAVKLLVREEGFAGVYQALGATLLKTAMNQAVRFTLFEQIKSRMRAMHAADTGPGADLDYQMTPIECLAAGAAAGAVSVMLNQPIDVVKSNLQGLDGARYRGMWHCATELLAEDGVRGLYKGLLPRLGRVMWEVGLVFSLYEHISRRVDAALQ